MYWNALGSNTSDLCSLKGNDDMATPKIFESEYRFCLLLLRFVIRNAPKWLHCLMWAVAAVKPICPFGFEREASPMD